MADDIDEYLRNQRASKKKPESLNPPAKPQDDGLYLPANPTSGDYAKFLSRNVLGGFGNVARVYKDEYSYGGADSLSANPDEERAKTKQADEELGGGHYLIRGMADMMSPSRYVKGGGYIRNAVVGGAEGAAQAYGHGGSVNDILKGAATGSGVSGAMTAAGQAVRPIVVKAGDALAKLAGKTLKTPENITGPLKDDAKTKFQQLDSNPYYAPHVGNAAEQIDKRVLNDPITRTASPGTNEAMQKFRRDIWEKARDGQPSSAGDVHNVIKNLNEVAQSGSPLDRASASKAADHFKGLFDILRPTNGVKPSAVVEQFNAANDAHGLFKNAEALEGMDRKLTDYGDLPGPSAKTMVEDSPQFYNDAQKKALKDIATSGGPDLPVGASSVTGAGLGFATGHPLAGGALGVGSDLASRFLAGPATARRAITAGYPALTGKTAINPQQAAVEAANSMGRASVGAQGSEPNPYNYIPPSLGGMIYPWLQ